MRLIYKHLAPKSFKSLGEKEQVSVFNQRSKCAGFLLVVLRAVIIAIIDISTGKLIPKMIYGTNDLDLVPDILIKGCLLTFLLATLSATPLDHLLR